MHDALRQRLVRKIESLPDEQIYQVLDFIEFLELKYADSPPVESSGLQRFAENLEDKLRRKAVSPSTIREAFQVISAADRVLSGVSSAGKRILSDLNSALDPAEPAPGRPGETGTAPPPPANGVEGEPEPLRDEDGDPEGPRESGPDGDAGEQAPPR